MAERLVAEMTEDRDLEKYHREPAGDPRAGYRKGALQFIRHGRKLRGRWALVRMRARDEAGDGKGNWLLIKERDAPAREKPRAR